MSVEAITWALKQPVKQSSTKFVLVVLANCASAATGVAFPSIAYVCDSTGQNRKTVIASLQRLVEAGYIADSGQRFGSTKQIVGYRLRMEVQRDGDLLTERHYCYRSEEAGSGRYYIGVRTCLGEPVGDTGYVGSGRWIQSCKANGASTVKSILSVHASRIAAEDAERSLIATAIDDPLCMNRVVPPKRAEIGTLSKGAENGTVRSVPNPDGKSPENGRQQSQKRDTEPSVTERNRQPSAQQAARFDDFWSVYPHKRGKKPSQAKWKAKRLDAQADAIIADVQRRIAGDERWLRGVIPDPLTYLNQERWEDELSMSTPSVPRETPKPTPSESKLEAAIKHARRMRELGQWDDDTMQAEIAAATQRHRGEARA